MKEESDRVINVDELMERLTCEDLSNLKFQDLVKLAMDVKYVVCVLTINRASLDSEQVETYESLRSYDKWFDEELASKGYAVESSEQLEKMSSEEAEQILMNFGAQDLDDFFDFYSECKTPDGMRVLDLIKAEKKRRQVFDGNICLN